MIWQGSVKVNTMYTFSVAAILLLGMDLKEILTVGPAGRHMVQHNL
jgi:hypothetical protein